MNDPFVHEQAAGFATRVRGLADDDARRIALAHEMALGRSPTPDEIRRTLDFLDAYRAAVSRDEPGTDVESAAWSALARTLLIRNEFLFVD
jgi:hypothetical protein